MSTPAVPEPPPDLPAVREGVLPSGRTVVIRADSQGEAIEVRSAGGEMELRIALTEQGPVLTLRGARLEIDAADTVAVNCRHFAVRFIRKNAASVATEQRRQARNPVSAPG